MTTFSLKEISVMAQGIFLQGNPDLQISSIHFDTRLLETGGLFLAIESGARDGHDFLYQAFEKGAQAAIITSTSKIPDNLPSDFGLILVNDTIRSFQKLALEYRRNLTLPIIAVTGSNGKTTTKDIIAQVLSYKFNIYKTFKNLNNHLGVPYSLLQINQTHEAAVLELGMNHAGEIDLLASLAQPLYSVITMIGDSHIEYFGSRDKIALAKAELLPHTSLDGTVYLNQDSVHLNKVKHLYRGKPCMYSVESQADIWASDIISDEKGTQFVVHVKDYEPFPVFLPLYGKHNVSNTLPAIGIGLRFGMTQQEIREALANAQISAMRFEVLNKPSGLTIINDAYNASPASMMASLETFSEIMKQKRKIVVLGDMFELGEDSSSLHAEVGTFASNYADQFELLVTVGDASKFIHESYQGESRHFSSKDDVVEFLTTKSTDEYVILFKASRGMKMETIIEQLK